MVPFISAGKTGGTKFFKGEQIFSENIGPPGPFFSEIFGPGGLFWGDQLLCDRAFKSLQMCRAVLSLYLMKSYYIIVFSD